MGKVFITQDVSDQIRILQNLKQHPELCETVKHMIYIPSADFPKLFRLAVTIKASTKPYHIIPEVMKRFNVGLWLNKNPESSEINEISSIVTSSINNESF